jgi:16S rRNA (guanine966-N2)-methyltransferase
MRRDVKKITKAIGAIRIISGRWRGRKLPVLDVSGLRPTTDKNKEMLFNWLMPYIVDANCLDAFAGSGSLGFEALSRDAKSVTFIELDKQAARNLSDNIHLLEIPAQQVKVKQGNAKQHLAQSHGPFDVIFLDPPFNQDLLAAVIDIICQYQLLAEGAVIYIECEGQGSVYSAPVNWYLLKQKQTPQILSCLYQYRPD